MSTIKTKLHKFKKRITHPERIIMDLNKYKNYKYARFIPDKLYIKSYYKIFMGKPLTNKELKNPKTLNEKLNWMKLNYRRPDYTVLADKDAVKDFIAKKIGKEYVIPTIGVYDSVDDVPFDDLPDKYVIKCTHDGGSTYLCTDKATFDVEKVKEELRLKQSVNFYWTSREPQYKNIKPRIIVEEFLCDEDGNYPMDYKFFCYDGKAKYIAIHYDRFVRHTICYYDVDFNRQDFTESNFTPEKYVPIERPEHLDKMIEISEKLSEGTPIMRVDLYYINNHIYVGELTICSGGGVNPYSYNGDLIMGEPIVLPNKIK